MSSVIRPFVKWAGGKRALLGEIRNNLPPSLFQQSAPPVYYEPFVGGGALLFDLQPKKAVINDYNPLLSLSYRVIRDDTEGLIDLLKNYKNDRDYYYCLRGLDRDTAAFNRLSDTKKAARLIYLNHCCYNGLYRVNSSGCFNVPFGRYRNPRICDQDNLRAAGAYLRENSITILSVDFEEALRDAGHGSFVYLDPPYHSPDRRGFTSYAPSPFGSPEQIRLRDCFVSLDNRGALVLQSNADTPLIRELYRDFHILGVQAPRPINSRAAGRGKVNEVLIKNY